MDGHKSQKIYPINVKRAIPSGSPPEGNSSGRFKYFVVFESVVCIALVIVAAFLLVNLSTEYIHEYRGSILPTEASIPDKMQVNTIIDEEDAPIVPADTLPLYDFSMPVPESVDVGSDYFSDTVFIGDSRTQGLLMYTDLKPAYNFAAQGANVASISTKAYISLTDDDGQRKNYTLTDALVKEAGNYKSIYISTGINELGWRADLFINAFRNLIYNIRAVTDVPIYVQLIMPVTTAYENASPYGVRNSGQVEFNNNIKRLAEEMDIFYLDPTMVHALEDGSLDPSHTFDGAHLLPDSYEDMANYYRTHVVELTAYANTNPSAES